MSAFSDVDLYIERVYSCTTIPGCTVLQMNEKNDHIKKNDHVINIRK